VENFYLLRKSVQYSVGSERRCISSSGQEEQRGSKV
jgi:hypothetical protein